MSELKVDKITPRQGTTLTLGDSGDTINFGSGVLPNFENLTVTGDLTVDTNSLKVDSTNNFVGIGTASPSVALDVVGAITATGNITGTLATASQPNITSVGTLTSATISGDLAVGTDKLFVDVSASTVGLGTTSPNHKLEMLGGTPALSIKSNNTTNGTSNILLGDTDDDDIGKIVYEHGTNSMRFTTNASERMRIDNSGNLLVDKTSISYTTVGHELKAGGRAFHTADGGKALTLTRLTSNGGILDFYNASGQEIGTIGIISNDNLYITNPHSNTQKGIGIADDNIYPVDNSGNSTNNQLDIGDNSAKFKDAYFGGTVTANAFSGDGSGLTGISSPGGATGVDFNDNVKARFGTGNDLEIYHDGSHSYISDQGTGDLRILATDFRVKDATDSEFLITGTVNAGVALYHDNSIKLQTTSTGATLTGDLLVTEATPTITITDTDSNGSAKLFCDGGSGSGNLYIDADTNDALADSALHLRVDGTDKVVIDSNGDVSVGDNQKIMLGNSDDLQIYHDGSDSRIEDRGTGNLILGSNGTGVEIRRKTDSADEAMVIANNNGSVDLYYDNSKKFETTANGVKISSGRMFASGGETISVGFWCKWRGTGTVTLEDDFNVSSIGDVANGQYDVNFTVNCGNANYAVAGTSTALNHSGWNVKSSGIQNAPTNLSTGSVRITSENTDSYYMSCIGFGDW